MTTVAYDVATTVKNNPGLHQYELIIDGRVAAIASYVPEPGGIIFVFTELMAGFEGRGLGNLLAAGALSDARTRDLIVTPRCPFFSTYIEDHPGFADVLGPDYSSLARK